MGKIKLSFIVPMYNSEKYLKLCFDSMLNQDISHEEYEIICINDGSTDRTKDISLQYKNKYPNFHYYEQENRGLSNARNIGLTKAQGEYIWFFDSDDEIVEVCLNRLLSELETEKLDALEISAFKGKKIKKNNSKFKFKVSKKFRKCTCHSKIIKKSILIENSIIFNEKFTYAEDLTWSLELEKAIKKLEYCKKVLYLYRDNESSLMRSSDVKEKSIKYYFKLLNEINNHNIILDEEQTNEKIQGFVWHIFMSNYSIEDKIILINFLETQGIYPYKASLIFNFSQIYPQETATKIIMYIKIILSTILLNLFANKRLLVIFFRVKALLINQNINKKRPSLNINEIEKLYYEI